MQHIHTQRNLNNKTYYNILTHTKQQHKKTNTKAYLNYNKYTTK